MNKKNEVRSARAEEEKEVERKRGGERERKKTTSVGAVIEEGKKPRGSFEEQINSKVEE